MINLTYDELEEHITKISSGKQIIYEEDFGDILVFNYPSNNVKLIADSIYKKNYKEAIEEGLLPLKDIEKLIKDRGVFTEEDEAQVEKLKGQLEAQNILLSKTLKVKANQDRIRDTIKDLKSKLNIILHKKHSKLDMSAENKALSDKTGYLCWACSFNIDDKRIWETFDDFIYSKESNKQAIVISYFLNFFNGLDTSVVRFIAKSNIWRIRYNNSIKTGEKLFGIPTTEYSTDQLSLVYWSNFYDQVYSMSPENKPADEIIEDDELLDSFMTDYYKELEKDYQSARSRKKFGKKMSAFDAEEVIVTRSSEMYEDIDYDKPREARKIADKGKTALKESQKNKKQRMKNATVTVDTDGKAKVER